MAGLAAGGYNNPILNEALGQVGAMGAALPFGAAWVTGDDAVQKISVQRNADGCFCARRCGRLRCDLYSSTSGRGTELRGAGGGNHEGVVGIGCWVLSRCC